LEREVSQKTRRERIVAALCERMLARGFAATSLTEVARAAHMTPSHLLYYFRDKEEVLNACFESLTAQLLEGLSALGLLSAEERLDGVADFFFGGKRLEKNELGLTLEFFGLAVHDKSLHATKAQLDRIVKGWLSHLFAACGCRAGSTPEDAAESAWAMIVGLSTSSFFDERLALPRARALLRESLHTLAGRAVPGKVLP
jgi:AcrR family transcriptional regulator